MPRTRKHEMARESKPGTMMSFNLLPHERATFDELKEVIEGVTERRLSNSEMVRIAIIALKEKYISRLREVVFAEGLPEEEQEAARKIFERLDSGELRLSELYEKVSKSGGIKE